MKNLKFVAFYFSVVFITLTLTSCLNEEDDNYSNELAAIVTIQDSAAGTIMKADFAKGILKFSGDLAPYGLEGAERALIYFTVPKSEDLTSNSININLVPEKCSPLPVLSLSNRPDTCGNDFITDFYDVYEYGKVWADNGYVNLGYTFVASDRAASFNLVQDSIKNDTLFLGLRIKANQGLTATLYPNFLSFRLPSVMKLKEEGIQPVNDSIYVSISGKLHSQIGSKYIYEGGKCKFNY